MTFMKKKDGFSVIELLVVIGVAGVLLAMGGTLAGRFAARHSVDNVTRTISSTLQIVKIKAARQGLEYQAVLTFSPSANTLTIVTQRGNSNRGSTSYADETSETIGTQDAKVTISPNSVTYNFNPNGTLGGASGTVNVKPADGASGKRCGKVVVSPFGRISVVEGTWQSSGGGSCSPVY